MTGTVAVTDHDRTVSTDTSDLTPAEGKRIWDQCLERAHVSEPVAASGAGASAGVCPTVSVGNPSPGVRGFDSDPADKRGPPAAFVASGSEPGVALLGIGLPPRRSVDTSVGAAENSVKHPRPGPPRSGSGADAA